MPYYLSSGNEIPLFEAAFGARLPVMIKGPTGCGKTRFVEFMAHRLGRPLITVACHEDLFASDLIGRYLLKNDETVWVDGPLTRAVRSGAICYLDEIVEARKDTTVVIHPLSDHRRCLSIDKKGEALYAHPDFMLVISYNPGYQSVLKDLKQSTRQRFVAFDFGYPDTENETEIVAHEGGVDVETARNLVSLAQKIRNIREQGLTEGASTRLLIHAARLICRDIPVITACKTAICRPLTDDDRLLETLDELIEDIF
jgi:nitric oxide reductase NorQ protein